MKRLHLLVATVVALVLIPASAFGYSYTFSCGPSWPSLPVSYYINEAGSGDIAFNTLQSVVADSFAAWGEPCCSNFAAAYQGTTQLTATNNQGRVILSWVESNWNPNWGNVNVTIGITFSQVYNNCAIAQAPILFNGVGFRFSTDGSGTDVQAIATHEIGHLLGLGHSQLSNATMYAAYTGSTGARSLHQDDVDGVCSLYRRSCSCVSNSGCSSDEICSNQQCVPRPCTSDAECDPGLECNQQTGDCIIPPCSTDAECAAGFVCQSNICVSGCPVCRRNCETNADCGSAGYCVDDESGGKVCLVLCGENAACPGDSVCYRVPDGQGGEVYVCGADNATSSLCPEGYVCQGNDIVDECASDADCSSGLVCANSVTGRTCQTPPDPCAGVTCGTGEVCDNGSCVPDGSGNNTNANNTNSNNNDGGSSNNATTGGTGSGSQSGGGKSADDPRIIVFPPDEDVPEDRTCSTAPSGEMPGALLFLGFAAWAGRRRRR